MGKEKIVGLLVGGHKLKIVEVENDYKAFKRALGIESPVADGKYVEHILDKDWHLC